MVNINRALDTFSSVAVAGTSIAVIYRILSGDSKNNPSTIRKITSGLIAVGSAAFVASRMEVISLDPLVSRCKPWYEQATQFLSQKIAQYNPLNRA